eukprot:Unigene10044_Nuclearia_a/m.30683 Unigene10044_Nuclearia_a/g.30683  ORF Unigene10044_Nuclearia_a/g.30683 Unigene10044_Nuclearia_a/m.30683 type:complete len:346 (+) Unigene10044_Nuclearia_a:333-1370(+)
MSACTCARPVEPNVSIAYSSPSSMRAVAPLSRTIGTVLSAWILYVPIECPLRLRIGRTVCVRPLIVTSCASITSCTVAPISLSRASMPAARMPAFVASRTASLSGSNCGSNETVKAQSMMRPLTCVPKSILHTSPYCSTVVSPGLGVQCAAQWLSEQPVGNAVPALSPSASISSRTEFSMRSQISVIVRPGWMNLCASRRTCRCTSAAQRRSLYCSCETRSPARFSSLVVRYVLWSVYSCTSPAGYTPPGKNRDTGTLGGSVCARPGTGATCPAARASAAAFLAALLFFFFLLLLFFFPPPSPPPTPPPPPSTVAVMPSSSSSASDSTSSTCGRGDSALSAAMFV